MTTATMNISLPEALRAYVADRVTEGNFANASDFVRALIRDDQVRQATAILELQLLEGIASGRAVAATDDYWDDVRLEVHAPFKPSRRKK